MAVEYAPKGLIGLLTPQANTTVEPEYFILLPPGYTHINARLTSNKKTIIERLVDYADKFDEACDQFANAPIQAIAAGCTGVSYLIGREREEHILAELSDKRRVPAFTAATAIIDALKELGARRVALASPYPKALTDASVGYWESHGLTVTDISSAEMDESQFHPIYSLKGEAAGRLLEGLGKNADAVLMLGTGMPTLAPLLAANAPGRVPVLSCMLALAWKGVACIDPDAYPLEAWLYADHWRERYLRQLPAE